MKNFFNQNILLTLYLSLFSCKKDNTPATFSVSNDLYDYVVFKPETQWIYEDSAPGYKVSVDKNTK